MFFASLKKKKTLHSLRAEEIQKSNNQSGWDLHISEIEELGVYGCKIAQ